MQSDNEETVDVYYLKREAFAAKQTKIHSITKHLEVCWLLVSNISANNTYRVGKKLGHGKWKFSVY